MLLSKEASSTIFESLEWLNLRLSLGEHSNHYVNGEVFANDPDDLGSITGWVTPRTQKMLLDASLLNTLHYKVRIKSKVEQSREMSSALPYTLVL